MTQGQIFQFGKFQIDGLARTLRREGAVVKLNSRVFDVLLYLVQNPGKVVTRDELLKNVWRDTFVDEHSLAQSISVLRRALEEKPGDNSYIVTLPGRGYQFVSEVQIVASMYGSTPPEVAMVGRSNPGGVVFQRHTIETSVTTSKEEKKQRSSPISQGRPLIITVAAVLTAVLVVVVFFRLRTPQHREFKHELLKRRLTANPRENTITSQAISRDGKFLAYRDVLSKNHLHLLAVDSGEIRDIPLPTGYEVDDWFPDGNHLLLESDVNGGGLWKVSTWDFSLRKLWSGLGGLARVSPDGSHIAFVHDDEIWLMEMEGEQPHRILASDASLAALEWSPTGQRLAYLDLRGANAKQVTIETSDLAGAAGTVVLSNPHLWSPIIGTAGIAWLPDGRIICEIHTGDTESDLWAIRVDPGTGQRSGETNRFTDWKDFEPGELQATADGNRLIATQHHVEDTIYAGDLASGSKVFTPHRVLLDDWNSVVTGWTKDSKAILFYSKRNGRWVIFKQDIDAKTPETLIAGSENYFRPKMSAEGTILYMATASSYRVEPGDTTIRLMSTPLEGGARSTLMMGRHEYACAFSSSTPCVVSELNDGQLAFSFLDPLKGKGEEIASITGYKGIEARWDLSPDGSKIAIVDDGGQKGQIQILNLADKRISVLQVRKWQHLQHVRWAADGKRLFAVAFDSSLSLLSVEANGAARVLYEIPEGAGWIYSIVPSPDGRRLAFTKRVFAEDVMLLENF